MGASVPDEAEGALPTASQTVLAERALVDLCVAGDGEAWEELYTRYNAGVRATIKSLFVPKQWDPNAIDEIASSVWYLALANDGELLDRFDPERGCRLSTFLGSIAKGVAGSFLRSERRRRRRERLASRPESDDGDATLGLTPSEIREFVAELTPREQQFLTGHLLHPVNGTKLSLFSDAYRWQLRSRICRKLREFVFRES